jgi:hypothetical protein
MLLRTSLESVRHMPCTEGIWPFPPVRLAAPIAIQQPVWFTAQTGARRTFQSARDMLAYEAGVRAFHDRADIGPIGSPHWQGWRDAEAGADSDWRSA